MNFLPKDINQNSLLKKSREINWKISKLLKSYSKNTNNQEEYQRKLKISDFSSGPVTEADIKVNTIIITELLSFSSQWEILSEENIKSSKEVDFKSDWVWIIDPLDGTKDFIQNTGEYAVQMALSFKKEIVFGTVLIPSKNELWLYQKGKGTWLELENELSGISPKLNKKELSKMAVVISRNHCPSSLKDILGRLNPFSIIGMGSVGYKIASILRGDADLYISYSEPGKTTPKDWDMAAPAAIIRGLGGYLTNEKGEELKFLDNNKFSQSEIMIASLNTNHQNICQFIKSSIY